ncbi:MAG: glycosyltransferase family 1 protein [Desulfobacterales bacterium]|nr:glycosyltransferase family 1 protein [Desulfobacterales bacterium]
MKILLVAKPWKGGLAKYVSLALEEMFPGSVRWLPTYPDTTAEQIKYRRNRQAWRADRVSVISGSDPDAVIFINHMDAFRHLRHRSRHILWVTDAPKLDPADAAPYGRIFISDGGYEKEILASVGPDVYGGELSFAHHPPIHRPMPSPPRLKSVCFVGNTDPARDRLIEHLFRAGLRPTVVGNYFLRHPLWWRHPLFFRPGVPNEAMGRIYARHRVSLNIHARVIRGGTNMRTFECAGFGISQVVDANRGVETAFDPETEILTYDRPEEMVAQIRRLLEDPERSARIAANARRRALSQHTYYHRMLQLLSGVIPDKQLRAAAARVGVVPQGAGPGASGTSSEI